MIELASLLVVVCIAIALVDLIDRGRDEETES